MDDIKTMYQKVKEIFTTEHHIDLVTDNMLTEQLFTDYISSQLEPLVMQNYTDTWQLCPKCNGQGIVSKPPYIAGDQQTWSSSSAVHTCDVCNGNKIIKR